MNLLEVLSADVPSWAKNTADEKDEVEGQMVRILSTETIVSTVMDGGGTDRYSSALDLLQIPSMN